MRPDHDHMHDPRFKAARVREIRPVPATSRETLDEYLARGGAVTTGSPDPRIVSNDRPWRDGDLRAIQHGWTWIQGGHDPLDNGSR